MVQHNILFEAAPPPRRFNPAVPRDLQVIAMKAMEKNPNDRFQSAREMAEDLRRFVRIEPIHAQPPGAAEVARRFARRHWIASASIATLALLGLLVWLGYGSVQAGRAWNRLCWESSNWSPREPQGGARPTRCRAAGGPRRGRLSGPPRPGCRARNAEELESRVKAFFAPSGAPTRTTPNLGFPRGRTRSRSNDCASTIRISSPGSRT